MGTLRSNALQLDWTNTYKSALPTLLATAYSLSSIPTRALWIFLGATILAPLSDAAMELWVCSMSILLVLKLLQLGAILFH